MIDNFSLALSHGLIILAAIILLRRPDLDREDPPEQATSFFRPRGHRDGQPDA